MQTRARVSRPGKSNFLDCKKRDSVFKSFPMRRLDRTDSIARRYTKGDVVCDMHRIPSFHRSLIELKKKKKKVSTNVYLFTVSITKLPDIILFRFLYNYEDHFCFSRIK